MIKMDLQLFGGRGSSSGGGGGGARNYELTAENSGFQVYEKGAEADAGLGINGGATDEWKNSLSWDERDAIEDYTGSGYEDVNNYLRLGSDVSDQVVKQTNDIEGALDKFELTQDTMFHRGASPKILGGASTLEEIQGMVGSVVVDKGFASTSATKMNAFQKKPLQFHIATPKGKGIGAFIKPLSDFYGENEFLFNRGSVFKITGAYEGNNGKIHVNMEYVGRTN